jgi:hypothetical protein
MMRVREDLMLTFAASRRLTGANVHNGRALIAAYQMAIETASDRRCHGSTKQAAIFHVAACETALRAFTGGRA